MQSVTEFFLYHKLGITDIIEKVQRTGARCTSNLDRDLNTLQFNNLCALLDDYPDVTHLYFTSSAVARWCRRELRKCTKNNRQVNGTILFGPGPAANIAAAGILNRDERDYEFGDSIRFHTTQIPFINERVDVERLKISKWTVRLENVPGLVRPEILDHPSFLAIKNRL